MMPKLNDIVIWECDGCKERCFIKAQIDANTPKFCPFFEGKKTTWGLVDQEDMNSYFEGE